MNKMPSMKLIGFWLTILLVVILAAVWMIWSIRSNAAVVQELHIEIQGLLQQSASLDKFKKIASDSKKEKEQIETYLISKDDQITFIESIEAIGKEQETVTRIDSVNEKLITGQNRNLLTLEVYVKGPWQATMRTLDLIESMPHKIDISQLELRKLVSVDAEAGTEVVEWEASFELNAVMSK